MRRDWTRDEVLAALHLYTQLSFGQLHKGNADIKALAAQMDRTPSSVAMKLTNLASLDPQITANGRKGLSGASELDRAVWGELECDWDTTALVAQESYLRLLGDPSTAEDIDAPETWIHTEGRTRTTMVRVRANQHLFRRAVLNSYKRTCCISGLSDERLLIASHIVPWREDHHNRLNPRNGLCLSALHDRAFDQGLIAVSPNHRVLISPALKSGISDTFLKSCLLAYEGATIAMPERFQPDPAFLRQHCDRFGFRY